jgi:hypothetical protein
VTERADPLHLVRRPAARQHGRSGSSSSSLQPSRSSSPHHGEPSEKLRREQSFKENRRHKFIACLEREDVDMGPSFSSTTQGPFTDFFFFSKKAELRKLAWSGIPDDLRPLAWPLLLVRYDLRPARARSYFPKGYLPLPTRLRSPTLERKRGEYQSLVDLTFAKGKDGLDQQIWHQIEIDVPRTRPGVPLWMHASTQRVWLAHYRYTSACSP